LNDGIIEDYYLSRRCHDRRPLSVRNALVILPAALGGAVLARGFLHRKAAAEREAPEAVQRVYPREVSHMLCEHKREVEDVR
jgi:hypothetical protein